MCYAIPGKVTQIAGNKVTVDYFGEEKKALNEFYDIRLGDYICAQGGYVIKKVPAPEAQTTLSAWRELFFELRKMDLSLSRLEPNAQGSEKVRSVLDKALKNFPLKQEELLYLLNIAAPQDCQLLFKTANFLRQEHHKNSCCVHGIIEISNHCRRACAYCGISAHNKTLTRYRMTAEEIVSAAVEAVDKFGFQALVLQSGEDPGYSMKELTRIIKTIKEKTAVLICVSFGEVGLSGLEELFGAGARGLLMRFETSNSKLYEKLHPGQTLKTRREHIRKAAGLGYMIMTGGLIGLPGQTQEDILNDIHLAKDLCAEIYSFGPFLPHPRTPLAGCPAPAPETVLKTLALIRLVDAQNAKILITTSLETLNADTRRQGLLAGANSLMLNVTPVKYRRQYSIYPNRAYNQESINVQIKETVALLQSLGRAPTDLGIKP